MAQPETYLNATRLWAKRAVHSRLWTSSDVRRSSAAASGSGVVTQNLAKARSSPRVIRRRGVHVRPRATGAAGSTITFADDSTLDARTVIWATGFGVDYSYIEAPVFSDDGAVIHTRGVTAASGLYFLGMPWQHTRGSALLGWVKDDAQRIADQISKLATVQVDAPTSRGRSASVLGV